MRHCLVITALTLAACTPQPDSAWQLVDDFETAAQLSDWTIVDVQNDTDPHIPNPQIAQIRQTGNNSYFIQKPAADEIVGNRKAVAFRPLPTSVPVGQTYTFYTRINVEYFPNNQSFGLSNLPAQDIPAANYDAFEPMIRVTDKAESNGEKNDGTLMLLSGYKTYAKIKNPNASNDIARPLVPGTWYELWYVVNNAPKDAGGQTYDIHVRGGEFAVQTKAFEGAVFRMNREAPLSHFKIISNTGPASAPYGNGGVMYDDIYMAVGARLSSPLAP